MSIDFRVKAHKRISKNLIDKNFYKVDHVSGDYIICEHYQDEMDGISCNIDVNISKVLGYDLSLDRYVIFRYGKENSKKENSCFSEIKGQDFRKRKSDITLFIFDQTDNKVHLVCGEVKKTLKHASFAEAREQLISSHIDLNIFNALLLFNYYPIDRIFFIASETDRFLTRSQSASSLLGKYSGGKKSIPLNLLREEYNRRKIYFNLDEDSLINKANKDISKLDQSTMMSAELKFVLAST